MIDDFVSQQSSTFLNCLFISKFSLSLYFFNNFISCWSHLRKNLAHLFRERVIHCSFIDFKAVLKHVRSNLFIDLLKQVNVFSVQVEQSVVLYPAEEQLLWNYKVLVHIKNIVVKSYHLINVLLRVVPEEAKELVIVHVAFVPLTMPVRATIDVRIAKVSLVVVVEL